MECNGREKELPYDFDLLFDIKTEKELWDTYEIVKQEYFQLRNIMFAVVMVRAKDPADAVRLSLEGGGDAGKVTVYSEIAWMGLEEGENLIIGFAS